MKQKRIAAAVVMVCMVLLALPLGVNRSLTKLREEAENSYYYDSTGFAVYSGIDAREDAASNMLTVAKRYTEENEKLEPLINELAGRSRFPKTPPTGILGRRPRPTCVWETPPRYFLRSWRRPSSLKQTKSTPAS